MSSKTAVSRAWTTVFSSSRFLGRGADKPTMPSWIAARTDESDRETPRHQSHQQSKAPWCARLHVTSSQCFCWRTAVRRELTGRRKRHSSTSTGHLTVLASACILALAPRLLLLHVQYVLNADSASRSARSRAAVATSRSERARTTTT